MKLKKLISLLLAVVLTAALVPAAVFADADPDPEVILPGDGDGGEGDPSGGFEIPKDIAAYFPELHIYSDEAKENELVTFDQIKGGERYWYEFDLTPGYVLTNVTFLSKDADKGSFVAPFDGLGNFLFVSAEIVSPGDVVVPFCDMYDKVPDPDDPDFYTIVPRDYAPLLNSRDVLAIMKLIVGIYLEDDDDFIIQEEYADYNLDGKVNSRDVIGLMKNIVGAPEAMALRMAGGVQSEFEVNAKGALAGAVVPDTAEAGEAAKREMTADEVREFILSKLDQFDPADKEYIANTYDLSTVFDVLPEQTEDSSDPLIDVCRKLISDDEPDADPADPVDGEDNGDVDYFLDITKLLKVLGLPDFSVVVLDGIDANVDGVKSVLGIHDVSNGISEGKTTVGLSNYLIDCEYSHYERFGGLFDDPYCVMRTDAFDDVNSYHIVLVSFPGVMYDEIETVTSETVRLSEEIESGYLPPVEDADDRAVGERMIEFSTDFVFETMYDDYYTPAVENTVVSPISIAVALAMAASGAEGETAIYFEHLFGDLDKFNEELGTLVEALSSDDGRVKVTFADSVWVKDGVTVLQTFFDRIGQYFDAQVYDSKPFDATTVEDVNSWVSDHTLGLIKELVTEDNIADAALLLLNAVAFEANWTVPFDAAAEGSFTAADGSERVAEMMNGSAERYVEHPNGVTGFAKSYEGGKYSFVAMLAPEFDDYFGEGPDYDEIDEDSDLDELSDADREKEKTAIMLQLALIALRDYCGGSESTEEYPFGPDATLVDTAVDVTMPKFRTEYSLSFTDKFFSDGDTPNPFDASRADFSGIDGLKDLFIFDVIHKAVIDVNEEGTSAAAATAVVFEKNAIAEDEADYSVTLDRPFVYAIVDNETGIPLFIGVCADVGTPAE